MFLAKRTLLWAAAACLAAAVAAPAFAQQAPPAEGNEAQLIAVLQSDAPLFDKAKACQRLATIGTKKCVPVLAKLLGSQDLSHYARYGLEPNPDPAVDAALRNALDELKGGLLVGVIDSIGMRRDAGAVDAMKKLLGDSDPAVASAAAWTLGRIATPEALAALKASLSAPASLRVAAADACLSAADAMLREGKADEATKLFDALREAELPKHLQIAALGGTIRARGAAGVPLLVECLKSDDVARVRVGLDMAHKLPGSKVTEALVAELANLPKAPKGGEKFLVINKAEYGAGQKWVDVIDKLAAAISNNGISVTAGNQLAGDPAPGTPKVLRVEYTLGAKQQTVEVPEKEIFEVQGDKAQHPREAVIISVLGDRGDKAALGVVLEAAKSSPWDIRLAAIRALDKLGNATAVPVLLATAVDGQGELAEAARDSLANLPGKDVDAALAGMLAESSGQKQLVVIEMVGRRGIASAAPALEKLADSGDKQVRLAAIASLGLTIGLDELPALVDRFLDAKTSEDGDAVKEALRKACMRTPDRNAAAAIVISRIEKAPPETKGNLLDLLGVVGGQEALEGVAAAAKSSDEALQDAATRVLGEWMSPDAAPLLLELAETGPEKFRVRSLRGYIRIPRQLDVSAEERLAMCRKAMAAADRNDEKKLVLEVLGRNPSAESLAMLAPYLDDPKLKEAAAAAAVALAEKPGDTPLGAVAEAMKKAAKATSNPDLAARARLFGRRAEKKLQRK